MRIHVFDAKLEVWGPWVTEPATRKLALPGASTLTAVHRLIQEAFGWADDHPYSFWLDGNFWGNEETEYTAPFEMEESGGRSSDVALVELGLAPGQTIAYIFDFGDEWRVSLRLLEIREGGKAGILESIGDVPPQYPDHEDEEN